MKSVHRADRVEQFGDHVLPQRQRLRFGRAELEKVLALGESAVGRVLADEVHVRDARHIRDDADAQRTRVLHEAPELRGVVGRLDADARRAGRVVELVFDFEQEEIHFESREVLDDTAEPRGCRLVAFHVEVHAPKRQRGTVADVELRDGGVERRQLCEGRQSRAQSRVVARDDPRAIRAQRERIRLGPARRIRVLRNFARFGGRARADENGPARAGQRAVLVQRQSRQLGRRADRLRIDAGRGPRLVESLHVHARTLEDSAFAGDGDQR